MQVQVVRNNTRPVVHALATSLAVDVDSAPAPIAPEAYITDADNQSWPFLASLEVTISQNAESGDLIELDDSVVPSSMKAEWRANASTFRVEGISSIHDYNQILQAIKFRTQLDYIQRDRRISITVND